VKYGPQTEAIETLIEQLRTLTPEQAVTLDAAWGAARDAVWAAAWYGVMDAVRDAVRDAALDAVRDAVRDAALDAVWSAVRNTTRVAIWGAVLALLVQDLIDPKHFDALYGPWKSVMG